MGEMENKLAFVSFFQFKQTIFLIYKFVYFISHQSTYCQFISQTHRTPDCKRKNFLPTVSLDIQLKSIQNIKVKMLTKQYINILLS